MHENPYASPESPLEVDAGSLGVVPPPGSGIGRKLLRFLVIGGSVLGVAAIGIALMIPASRGSRPAARKTQCKNNLKQIGLALHNYAETHGAFPPAYTVDKDGRRLHSWRTLILPYIDQAPLYQTIDLSKPWNDPVNAKAYEVKLPVYQCPEADCPGNHSTYMAIVGEGQFFHPTQARRMSEVTDGSECTLMVVEVHSKRAVHWMEPRDEDVSQTLGVGPKVAMPHTGGVHASYVDGRVQFLSATMPQQDRQALISIAGKEVLGAPYVLP